MSNTNVPQLVPQLVVQLVPQLVVQLVIQLVPQLVLQLVPQLDQLLLESNCYLFKRVMKSIWMLRRNNNENRTFFCISRRFILFFYCL